jgi:hypothetical protein
MGTANGEIATMNYLAKGRWALVAALGFLAICASQAQAGLFSALTGQSDSEAAAAAAPAETTTAQPAPARQATRSARRTRHVQYRRHRSEKVARARAAAKVAEKAESGDGKAEGKSESKADGRTAAKTDESRTKIPDRVANANAQMIGPVADAAPEPQPTAVAEPAPETAAPVAPLVVASDELNELDKAAAEKPAPKVYRPVTTAQASAMPTEDVWSQTSLIGKIFVAFGGMLTLASAARMFMA